MGNQDVYEEDGENLWSPTEIIKTSKWAEKSLDHRRISENLYSLQNGLQDTMGKEVEISGVSSTRTIKVLHDILDSWDTTSIQTLQKLINQKITVDEAKIPEDGKNRTQTRNALAKYYGIDLSVSVSQTIGVKKEKVVDYNSPNITGKNLDSIDVQEDDAIELAEKVIPGFAEEENHVKRKELVAIYQEAHHIDKDAVIGKETYLEMRAGEMRIKIEEVSISKTTLENAKEILEKGANKKWKNVSEMMGILSGYKETHKNDAEFSKNYGWFYEWYDSYIGEWKKSPEWVLIQQEIKNTSGKDGKSIWRMMQDGDWEAILTNPSLLMFAWLWFIFGMFGSDTELTNAWWKRLLVIGVGVINTDSIKDIIKDVKWIAGSPSAGWKYTELKKSVVKYIGTYIPGADPENTTTNVDSLIADFNSKNLNLLSPQKIDTLHTSLWGNATFAGLKVDALKKISSMKDLNGILSADAQEALQKSGIEWKDVHTYITYIVIPTLNWKSFVEYLTEGTRNIVGDTVAWLVEFSGGTFVENQALNGVIQWELAPLVHTGSPAEKKASADIVNILLTTDVSLLASSGNLEAKLKQITKEKYRLTESEFTKLTLKLDKIKFIFAGEEYIAKKVQEVSDIRVVESGAIPDTSETLTVKIQNLANIKLDDLLLTGHRLSPDMFSKDEFQKAFDAKKEELFKKAKGLGMTTVNGVVIASILWEIQENQVLAGNKQAVETGLGTLEEIPKTTTTPLSFMTYYKSREAVFKNAQSIVSQYENATVGSQEAKLRDEASAKIELFKTNYETVRESYKNKITVLETEISDITIAGVDETTFLTRRASLETIMQNHALLRSEVIEGYSIVGSVEQMWNEYQNPFIPEPVKNSFEYLDTSLKITTPKPSVDTTQSLIQRKITMLEQGFDAKIDSTPVKLDDVTTVQSFVQKALEKQRIISLFQGSENTNRKKMELQDSVGVLVEMYKTGIVWAPNLTEAEIIYDSYLREVEGKIGANIAGIGGLIVYGSAVKDALTNKAEETKRVELLKKPLDTQEVQPIIDSSGFIEFITLYAETKPDSKIQRLWSEFKNNGRKETLWEVIDMLAIMTVQNGYSEEIQKAAKTVQQNLEAGVEGWIQIIVTQWIWSILK
jgi:hypothetical protein